MKELNIDDFYPSLLGCHIKQYCAAMLKEALIRDNAKIVGNFNGIKLEATSKTRLEELVSYYYDQSEKRRKKYMASDEYKEKQKQDAIQVQQYNDRLKKCIEILPYLKTNKEILMAINEIIDATDFIGVDNGLILKIAQILEDKGFKENVYIKDTAIHENEDICARYIIGQVLNMIYIVGAIHGVVHSFIKKYMDKFGDKHESNRKVS